MTITQTERLIIRELNTDDAAFIFKLLNDPTFIENIGDKKIRNLTDAENYITTGPMNSYSINGFGLFLTEQKTRDKNLPIGICGLIKRETLEDVDIGFAFLPEYTKLGFGFESANAMLNYGKETIGLKRIAAIVDPENRASIGLLKKMGFQYEHKIKLPPKTSEIDYYAINFS